MEVVIPMYKIQLVKESALFYNLSSKVITGPDDAAFIAREIFQTDMLAEEHFCVLLLNVKNAVIGATTVSVGSLTASVVHPREVIKAAVLANAAAMILVHNHPSGDPTPSREDITTTERLFKVGKLMDIPVLDHIILGCGGKYISLKERGHIA